MKKYIWGIFYGILLTAFTVYVMLDTFVITRVYTDVPGNYDSSSSIVFKDDEDNKKQNTDGSSSFISDDEKDSAETKSDKSFVTLTDSAYSDGNISITLKEYREHDTTIYVADVQVSSAEYLKTAFAKSAYGKNVTDKTSEIAEDAGAILAINGDYYGAREKGYVIRNGMLYRNTSSSSQEDLVIYKDGSLDVITEKSVSAQSLLDAGAQQVLSFGPALVIDGKVSVTEDEEVGKAMSSNPRTAIGIVDELHYLFVVSDGRTSVSEGLSLRELAEFMQSLGADIAYNLDGGGSSTMVFNGKVINNPTTNGKSIKERSVSDIVYIGY